MFLCFFAHLVGFDWMPETVTFTLLTALHLFLYSYKYSLAFFYNALGNGLSFIYCYKISLVGLKQCLMINPHNWGKTLLRNPATILRMTLSGRASGCGQVLFLAQCESQLNIFRRPFLVLLASWYASTDLHFTKSSRGRALESSLCAGISPVLCPVHSSHHGLCLGSFPVCTLEISCTISCTIELSSFAYCLSRS